VYTELAGVECVGGGSGSKDEGVYRGIAKVAV